MSRRKSRPTGRAGSPPPPSQPAAVSSGERLSFTGFVAVVVHAILILGISFSLYNRNNIPPTIEVTLSQYTEKEAPTEADYLAQHNQSASGTQEKKKELTTDKRADFADTVIRDVNPEPPRKQEKQEKKKPDTLVKTSSKEAPPVPENRQPDPEKKTVNEPGEEDIPLEENNEIASLKAKLSQQRQQYAKRPRIKTLTSVATRSSADAAYLNLWQEKIELVGNLNYPEEARRKKIYGQLRLLVSLLPDGTVYQIEILESSGKKVLDEAAIRTVRLSAPFAAFPPELRRTVDRLEIIRTWKFEKGDVLTSQ